jgi:hypothetical protein
MRAGHPFIAMLNLSAHVCFRDFEDGAILLDLRYGSYLSISAADVAALKLRISNWPPSVRGAHSRQQSTVTAPNGSIDNLASELLARGILTTSACAARQPPSVCPVTSLAVTGRNTTRQSLTLRLVVELIAALIFVKLRTRRGQLLPMLNWLERRQRLMDSEMQPNTEEIERLLCAHGRWRIWFYTAQNHCLLDSLVLSVFLTNRRVPNTFVIGVATKPFLAHAWVQIADSVLNDTSEYTQMFSPILAAGVVT